MAVTESDLLRSSLDLLVLKTLSWGPMHGYAISEWIESATDSRITLRADRELSLEKGDVVRVYRPPRHGRVFGAVLGGAIGVAAGGVLDGTLGQRFRNESDGPAKGLLTAGGAGVGAGIGVAVTGWYRTVYQREK